jgi:hypothetical protein
MTVTLPIEEQDENTPMSLPLDLPEQDLSETSIARIGTAIEESR